VKVRVLSDAVINKIAAGEVVERPASVVRELCDNALDAGARSIEVWLEQGGRSLIRVVDDGCGMERDDALLALERHATSKISDAEDLSTLVTRGFRGEALPSIAAVSRLELTTRTSAELLGTAISGDGGMIRSVKEISVPVGTTISVRGLFFNTPVRRRFLRSPAVEDQRVVGWLMRFALGVPEVRLRCVCDGKEVIAIDPHTSFIERARHLLRGDLREVDFCDQRFVVRGLVGHPGTASSSGDACVMLVNGRPISDRGVLRAIREGFQHTLKDREIPVAALAIEMDPSLVDVNVHPQKAEVRFIAPSDVWRAVREGVGRAIGRFGMTQVAGPLEQAPLFRERFIGGPQIVANSLASEVAVHTPLPVYDHGGVPAGEQVTLSSEITARLMPRWGMASASFSSGAERQPFEEGGTARAFTGFDSATPAPILPPKAQEIPRFSDLRYIGQLMRCYLLCEHGGSFYIVDMHAAHERINYNRIRVALRGRPMASQQLLCPEPISVGVVGVRRLRGHSGVLSRLGFEVEEFGPQEVIVRAIPPMIQIGKVRGVLLDIIEYGDIEYGDREDAGGEERGIGEGPVAQIIAERLDRLAARMACHASLRGGDELTYEQARALLVSLDDAELAGACPHGRPVVARFDKAQVEGWFGRDR
jgi:DNA mismatch repair protein MutL